MSFSFWAKSNGSVHVCGHRGHSIGAPENTIAAFRATRDLGGTTCEIDTVLTSDGEIVVIHDLLVDRTSNGSGAVCDMTLAELKKLDFGSWFGPEFAGTRISTLREAIDAAHDLDLGLEVEIKEKHDIDRYILALRDVLVDPRDRERVMMISFDHASLKAAKKAIPGLLTGGILHERLADPVGAGKAAGLDELCIDLAVFDPEDAQRIHDAGMSIRCHAYRPESLKEAARARLNWQDVLTGSLRVGLIDTLSGDDVAWLRKFVDEVMAGK